jgi:hypothetical protein
MLMGLGSVPSSGRPAWLTTRETSGISCKVARALWTVRFTSAGAIPAGSVKFTQMLPSFNSGRNSEPSNGTSDRHATNTAADTKSTTLGRASAIFNVG